MRLSVTGWLFFQPPKFPVVQWGTCVRWWCLWPQVSDCMWKSLCARASKLQSKGLGVILRLLLFLYSPPPTSSFVSLNRTCPSCQCVFFLFLPTVIFIKHCPTAICHSKSYYIYIYRFDFLFVAAMLQSPRWSFIVRYQPACFWPLRRLLVLSLMWHITQKTISE